MWKTKKRRPWSANGTASENCNEIEQFIRKENGHSDSTDGASAILNNITESAQEDFEEVIDAESDKKNYKGIVEIICTVIKYKRQYRWQNYKNT